MRILTDLAPGLMGAGARALGGDLDGDLGAGPALLEDIVGDEDEDEDPE